MNGLYSLPNAEDNFKEESYPLKYLLVLSQYIYILDIRTVTS